METWVNKRRLYMGAKWRRRFLVIERTDLMYFDDDNKTGPPNFTCDLSLAHSMTFDRNRVVIIHHRKKSFALRFISESEMLTWINVICCIANKLDTNCRVIPVNTFEGIYELVSFLTTRQSFNAGMFRVNAESNLLARMCKDIHLGNVEWTSHLESRWRTEDDIILVCGTIKKLLFNLAESLWTDVGAMKLVDIISQLDNPTAVNEAIRAVVRELPLQNRVLLADIFGLLHGMVNNHADEEDGLTSDGLGRIFGMLFEPRSISLGMSELILLFTACTHVIDWFADIFDGVVCADDFIVWMDARTKSEELMRKKKSTGRVTSFLGQFVRKPKRQRVSSTVIDRIGVASSCFSWSVVREYEQSI